MPHDKVDTYWFELNSAVKMLIQEIDKAGGPNWHNVFACSQDLMAISKAAMLQSEDKSPPA